MKMTNVNKLVRIFSNLLIAVIVTAVFIIGFSYKSVMPIISTSGEEAIYHGNTKEKYVSLMINVYENTDTVINMAKVLNEYGARATFFVGGCWADDNKEALNLLLSLGHEIGNHGYFHKDHKNLSYAENISEISRTETVVEALCGVKTNLFAPPSGSFSDKTLDASNQLGYKVIMWSKDTIDWRDNNEDVIFERATKNPENGEFVLMHPKEHTLRVLHKIVKFYQEKGYSLVCVSENLT